MSRTLSIRVAVLSSLLLLPCSIGRAQDLAVSNITVYSAPHAAAQKNVTVLIRHGSIASIGAHVRTPKGIRRISCEDCVVLAGFWNAHVHFMEPKWNDAAHQPADKLTHQLGEMLTHSGFTTVVDTGSEGENTIALRRRVESGQVLGPH